MPRKDLKVTVAGAPIKPGLALGSWTAFEGTPSHAMVMGDLVLTESEVEPVMMKLQEMGIQETAVHNHLLNESQRVMYMHIFRNAERKCFRVVDLTGIEPVTLSLTRKR
jgi:hypothetical protein